MKQPLTQPETPTLSKVILETIKSRTLELHTCMPGVVETVDHDKKCVDVILSLKRKYKDEETAKELPKLSKIPLGFLQTNTSIISVPVAAGDDVWVMFSERSIDSWKQNGGIVSPDDPRQHHLSDAVAVPMFKPLSKGIPSDSENVFIKNGDAEMKICPDGKVFLGNNTEELVSIVSELMQLLVDVKTNTQLGPQPFINNADFISLKQRIDNSLKK